MKPARVVAGRDISVGSRPIANSVSLLLVAFMLANSYEPSSQISSNPPAIITLAFPDSKVSQAISMDCNAVALQKTVNSRWAIVLVFAHQAPTGILIGPLEDNRSKLTHPAVVLMKLLKHSQYYALR